MIHPATNLVQTFLDTAQEVARGEDQKKIIKRVVEQAADIIGYNDIASDLFADLVEFLENRMALAELNTAQFNTEFAEGSSYAYKEVFQHLVKLCNE